MSANIAIIFGTRPEFIKLWPVWRGLRAEGIEPTVICTGQHNALIRQQMGLLDMPVRRWLDVMADSGGLNDTLRRVLEGVNSILDELQPSLVIVQGDTTSALGAAIAAYHRQIPVAHVEAGLRSNNPQAPAPEEVNRITIDALSVLLYCPTLRNVDYARQTNPSGRIERTGNTVVDSVQAMIPYLPEPMATHTPYVVLDLHRRESFGPQMVAMVEAVCAGADQHNTEVIWIVHPNPSVREAAMTLKHPRLTRVEPLQYTGFLGFVRGAQVLLTDSGGAVEEACSLGIPSLQLRDHTDRFEAIAAQCSWLTGRKPQDIEKLTSEALFMAETWKAQIRARGNPFGDGFSGQRIGKHIKEWL